MNIKTITHNGIRFVDVNSPTQHEIEHLHTEYGFRLLNLEDFLHKTQVPKIETYPDYSLIVMDFPHVESSKQKSTLSLQSTDNKISFIPNVLTRNFPLLRLIKTPRKKLLAIGEVDFFLGKDYLVVLHDEKTPHIDELFELCEKSDDIKKELMERGPVYLFYRIADVMIDGSFSVVDGIIQAIDLIDKQILEKNEQHIIYDVSVTRRNIVVFQTMIKPAIPIFSDLEKGKYATLNGTMSEYWSNLVDHLQKIWDRLEDNKEFIEGISRSHESLQLIRTNEIVKVLTVFTAIVLPLTLLASIYGMNITLPFAEDPQAFLYIVFIMIVTAIIMTLLFKLRDWL